VSLSRFWYLVTTEPAIFTAAVQTLITLGVQFGLSPSAAVTGAILAATTAALALLAAVRTRPFHLAALTGFVTAIGTLLLAFGVPHIAPGLVSSVNMVIVAAFAFAAVRPQVTPLPHLVKPGPAPVPPSPVPPATR
jgi:hypothetical protein